MISGFIFVGLMFSLMGVKRDPVHLGEFSVVGICGLQEVCEIMGSFSSKFVDCAAWGILEDYPFGHK
jgi:hypothetical protein